MGIQPPVFVPGDISNSLHICSPCRQVPADRCALVVGTPLSAGRWHPGRWNGTGKNHSGHQLSGWTELQQTENKGIQLQVHTHTQTYTQQTVARDCVSVWYEYLIRGISAWECSSELLNMFQLSGSSLFLCRHQRTHWHSGCIIECMCLCVSYIIVMVTTFWCHECGTGQVQDKSAAKGNGMLWQCI